MTVWNDVGSNSTFVSLLTFRVFSLPHCLASVCAVIRSCGSCDGLAVAIIRSFFSCSSCFVLFKSVRHTLPLLDTFIVPLMTWYPASFRFSIRNTPFRNVLALIVPLTRSVSPTGKVVVLSRVMVGNIDCDGIRYIGILKIFSPLGIGGSSLFVCLSWSARIDGEWYTNRRPQARSYPIMAFSRRLSTTRNECCA